MKVRTTIRENAERPKFLLLFLALLMPWLASAQIEVKELKIVQGLNADVVAEDEPYSNYFVQGIDNVMTGFYVDEKIEEIGLPVMEKMPVASKTGVIYDIDYTRNNALMLSYASGFSHEGTLEFITPIVTPQLYLLTVSGDGASTFKVVVNYEDGSNSEVNNIKVADWWNPSTNAADHNGEGFWGLHRMNRSNDTMDQFIGFSLYDTKIACDDSKKITSVKLTLTTGNTSGPELSILALSTGDTPVEVKQECLNVDIVAEDLPSKQFTTSGIDRSGFVFVSNNLSTESEEVAGGLPANGVLNSAFSGATYHIDYYHLNAARLDNDNPTATLTFEEEVKANTLYILYTACGGSRQIEVTYNYNDGTKEQDVFWCKDWYSATPEGDEAIYGLGRIYNNALVADYHFRLMEAILYPDLDKPIESITFNNIDRGGYIPIIMGLSCLQTPVSGILNPLDKSGNMANTKRRFNLSGQEVGDDYKGIVIVGGRKVLQR